MTPTPTDADVERVAAAIMAAKAFGEMWIDPVAIARAAIAAMPAPARVRELEEALRPFARVGDVLDFYVEEAIPAEGDLIFPRLDVRTDPDGPTRFWLTHDTFRRARTALREGGNG
jgi:hypothetical protein